jgi:putative transposase
MVRHPLDYRWSSYAINTGNHRGELVRPHPAYEALSADLPARHSAYASLLDSLLEQPAVDEIRKARAVATP